MRTKEIDLLIEKIKCEAEYERKRKKGCDEFLWHDSEVNWMLKRLLRYSFDKNSEGDKYCERFNTI